MIQIPKKEKTMLSVLCTKGSKVQLYDDSRYENVSKKKNRLTDITQKIQHKQYVRELTSSSVLCINADALTHNRIYRCTIRSAV